MTVQDDLASQWFQPAIPPDPHDRGRSETRRPDPGPMTTRIAGQLSLDEPITHTPAHPEPERIEVTQPYIPAIREQTPEFAKRLNPDARAVKASAAAPPAPPRPAGPSAPQTAPVERVPAQPADAPAAPPAPPVAPAAQPTSAPPAPKKRRSLTRRVVRRIVGPDLLRKDPVKKKR